MAVLILELNHLRRLIVMKTDAAWGAVHLSAASALLEPGLNFIIASYNST